MSKPVVLEITITHNLPKVAEVAQLFARRLIALDWGRKGSDPAAYADRAHTDVKLFHEMRAKGAAVIAAYKGATDKRSDRVVGWVEVGAEFVSVDGLLCLPLSSSKVADSSVSFLGNLPPRSCTVQSCHKRAKGRLAAYVSGKPMDRSVAWLHHLDVEWLVTNFLISHGLCASVWGGGRSFENIDHAGFAPAGRVVLGQTTVSEDLVGKKAKRLSELHSPSRDLLMFGPESARKQCLAGVRFYSIEEVFKAIDSKPEGRWLIDRMLDVAAG